MRDFCVFVCSSDNTFDVFSLMSENISKNWPVNDVDIYVGLNSEIAKAPFHVVSAVPAGWMTELECQIKALSEQYQYIILLLDDFFFYNKVGFEDLTILINEVKERNIDYLRLKPQERSGIGKMFLYVSQMLRGQSIITKLSYSEPYYSSLQVAIWKRPYLLNLLSQGGSIWEFEHRVVKDSVHYAVTHPVLRYEHLVEKGKWFKYAPAILDCESLSEFEKRGFDDSVIQHSRRYKKIKFFIFGYVVFKTRAMLSRFVAFVKNKN